MSEPDAWMEEEINWEEFNEITLALLDDRGREVNRDDAETYPRARRQKEAPAPADQGQAGEEGWEVGTGGIASLGTRE
jgi:hypothetical protein